MNTPMKALVTSAGVIILTLVHHFYGAVVYATPWRHHVALIALPLLAALIVSYRVHKRHAQTIAGRASMYIFIIINSVFSVGLIGVFEGVYNHLLKNILYFGGTGRTTLSRLFPPPRYEMPNDFVFEGTGILQAVVAIVAAYYTFRYWREDRRRTASV